MQSQNSLDAILLSNATRETTVSHALKNNLLYARGVCRFSIRHVFVVLISTLLSCQALAQQAADVKTHHESASMPVTHQTTESEPVTAEPQSLSISAGGIDLRFGGFAKLDFIQDFDYVGNQDQFKVNSIPVSGDPNTLLGGSSNLSARQTRLTMDIAGDEGDERMHAYIEGDFFGSGDSFRIRHAYGEWNGLLAGQTWTTFQDISARPMTLDYEGPDSEIFVRQAMIRYTATLTNGLEWAVAAEDPDSQLSSVSGVAGQGRSEWPDLVARVRWNQQWGHLQFAGIARQLRFVSNDGTVDEAVSGYGLNVAGSAKAFGTDTVMGHIGFGSGVGRYIESFGGTASDAVLTAGGSLEALDAWAWVLGYTHQWNQLLASTASIGTAEIDNDPDQGATAIKSAKSAHANLVFTPTRRVIIGGELMWGERENNDGSDGDATRLQVSVQYNFR
jgi:hypothetical protein